MSMDLKTHPMYVVTKALIQIVGIFIWLDGLKSGKFGDTVLKYIGFLVVASFVHFFAFAYSYGEPIEAGSMQVHY